MMLLRFQKEGVYQDVLQIGKHRHSKTWQGHPESSATEQGAHGCIGLMIAFSNHCFPERISQIVFVTCAGLTCKPGTSLETTGEGTEMSEKGSMHALNR